MTEDPTLSESKLHPFTSFCLLVFCFVPVCVSCGKEVAACYHSIALGYCVGVQRDLCECRESLMPAAGRGSPTPAVHVASQPSVNVASQTSVNVASRPPSAADSSPPAAAESRGSSSPVSARSAVLRTMDPVPRLRPGESFQSQASWPQPLFDKAAGRHPI